MILKHVEYKIICDNCASDIIEWDGYETREDVKEEYKKQYGKLPKKETLCDNCSTAVPADGSEQTVIDLATMKYRRNHGENEGEWFHMEEDHL